MIKPSSYNWDICITSFTYTFTVVKGFDNRKNFMSDLTLGYMLAYFPAEFQKMVAKMKADGIA